jgi:hypothetical protein
MKRSKAKPIYVLSTGRVYTNEHGERSDFRAVGWYPTLKQAQAAVMGNYGDIEEAGFYKWAVIEKLHWGLYPYDLKANWYLFVCKKRTTEKEMITAKKIKCPKRFKNICGFSIG